MNHNTILGRILTVYLVVDAVSSDCGGAFGSGASGSVSGITGGPASGSKIRIIKWPKRNIALPSSRKVKNVIVSIMLIFWK